MHYRLADGVNLEVISSSKFKLNQILINFATPQTVSNATSRHLLANLLETSTNKYPTQTALATQLAKQYGTDISVGVSRLGQLHCVRLKASFVNDQLAQTDLFNQAVTMIKEVLFNPLATAGQFDGPTFDRQATNLKATIKGYYDDKQFWAARRLLDLYYQDGAVIQVPSFGRAQEVDQLTPASVYQAYQDMLGNDRVDILFLGDTAEQVVKDAFTSLPFTGRTRTSLPIMYQQAGYRQVQRQVDYRPVSQAKLNVAYQLPTCQDKQQYYTSLVFNDLFGGSPYSKLYLNIREKASLAYYASSRLLPFNGLLTIQAGVNSVTAHRVEKMIGEQLVAIQQGQFTDDQLTEVKRGLINQYRSGNDLAGSILGRRLTNRLLNFPDHDGAELIAAVTKDQVVQVAKTLTKQAVYLLSGEI